MIAADRQPYLSTRHNAPFQFFGAPTVMHATGEQTNNLVDISATPMLCVEICLPREASDQL